MNCTTIVESVDLIPQLRKPLEWMTNGDVQNKIFFSPVAAAKINLVNYPAIVFIAVRFTQGERKVKSQDEKIEVKPEPKPRSDRQLF